MGTDLRTFGLKAPLRFFCDGAPNRRCAEHHPRGLFRDRSEIAELHGSEGRLEAVTLTDGTRLTFSFLFLFLGARPCTEWLGDAVARHDDGFVLTGEAAGAANLLETSVPGIFAAGDVRSGSTKRCAAAVGEGSMAVQFVHRHLSAQPAEVK